MIETPYKCSIVTLMAVKRHSLNGLGLAFSSHDAPAKEVSLSVNVKLPYICQWLYWIDALTPLWDQLELLSRVVVSFFFIFVYKGGNVSLWIFDAQSLVQVRLQHLLPRIIGRPVVAG